MMFFAPVLIVVVLLVMFLMRTKRSRDCRWRAQPHVGAGSWHCVACGAVTETDDHKMPDRCYHEL